MRAKKIRWMGKFLLTWVCPGWRKLFLTSWCSTENWKRQETHRNAPWFCRSAVSWEYSFESMKSKSNAIELEKVVIFSLSKTADQLLSLRGEWELWKQSLSTYRNYLDALCGFDCSWQPMIEVILVPLLALLKRIHCLCVGNLLHWISEIISSNWLPSDVFPANYNRLPLCFCLGRIKEDVLDVSYQ